MNEPTMPVSRYCDALLAWARVATDPRFASDEDDRKHRDELRKAWEKVELAISKSNLLARLIYDGQKLRTTPCPEHKGHWSGCQSPPPKCGCADDGFNVTGWLPEPGDTPGVPHGPFLVQVKP